MFCKKQKNMTQDTLFKLATGTAAFLIPLIMGGILGALVFNALPAIRAFGLKFLITNEWNPATGKFGAAASLFGTVLSSLIAMLMAVPASLFIAAFLSEFAPRWLKKPVRYGIETLAAIPSIIYGMWGLFVVAPFMSQHVQPFLTRYFGFIPLFKGPPMGIGMLNAGFILALMVLPFITSAMYEVFVMTPRETREAAYGAGATAWEVLSRVTLPQSLPGVVGALFLGFGRAIGETMAVTFVIGNTHQISSSLFSAGTTIASTLANEFTEASEGIYLGALFELGIILLFVNLIVIVIGQQWLKKLKQRGF